MKTTVFAALLFASTLAAGTAVAQPAPFNDVGVTMGHWHIISKDGEANKKLFVGMSGTRNNAAVLDLPGAQLRFAKAQKAQTPCRARVLDHIGFAVKDHAA